MLVCSFTLQVLVKTTNSRKWSLFEYNGWTKPNVWFIIKGTAPYEKSNEIRNISYKESFSFYLKAKLNIFKIIRGPNDLVVVLFQGVYDRRASYIRPTQSYGFLFCLCNFILMARQFFQPINKSSWQCEQENHCKLLS